jgi:hypothetical protein
MKGKAWHLLKWKDHGNDDTEICTSAYVVSLDTSVGVIFSFFIAKYHHHHRLQVTENRK